jgi:hypothetical protein
MIGKISTRSVIAAALALAAVTAATVPASAQAWGGPYNGYYGYAPGPVAPGPYYAPYGSYYRWGSHRHCDQWSIRGC